MGERRFHSVAHWKGGFDYDLHRGPTLAERVGAALDELARLDPNWEAWYDDDNNVPQMGTNWERLKILERRIAELRAQGVREEGSQTGFAQLSEIGFGQFGPM